MKKFFALFACACLFMTSCSDKKEIDLTKMSPTMIYSHVFQMVMDPDSYNGKTVKVAGYFLTLKDPFGNDSWTIIVPDATACCEQGLSFKWDFGEYKPAEKTDITVKGKFTVSELENGLTYYFIEGTEVTVNSR